MKKGDSIIKLSIVIPYHRTIEQTKILLNNIKTQLTNDVEVIVVDDDVNTTELDKYKSDSIKIIHHEKNSGNASKPRNTGKKEAKGKYTWFVDADDNIMPDAISKWINKIDAEEFDYCLCSWQYKDGRKVIIKDMPMAINTCVWNCIYLTNNIKNIDFPEDKNINEDTEFNKLARKGVKANIEDVLYIYNTGDPESITGQYSRGIIKEEKNEINTQVIVYRSFLSKIGGIETAVYNFCMVLKDKYDIVFMYDNVGEGNLAQLRRLKKIVRCENYKGQELNCDTFIYYGVNPQQIEQTLNAKKVIQQICNDFIAYPTGFVPSKKTTEFYADSEASANAFSRRYKLDCGVLHNLFDIQPKRSLLLMSASRLSPEKGYNRMKAMAKRMRDKEIPFIWTIFTNDIPNEEIDGFIFMKPRFNIPDYMAKMDYVLQLSDFESWGCTITESLECGIPVICTDFPSAYEQVEDGINGYILKRNLKNLDDVIDKMYNNDLKGFKYEPKYSIKEWADAIGDLGTPKLDYKYDKSEVTGYEVEVLKDCYYSIEQKQCVRGDTLIIGTEARLEFLEKLGYVKRIGELI